ncbi:glycosyltransferase family 39 protein [Sphingomonas sp. RT2P30]
MSERAGMTRGSHGVTAGLFVLVWLSCVWFGSWSLNPNNATRLFGALALVEQHDARIDRFESLTIDKAQFGNHHYIDKAPGMTLMAVPWVWAANAATHSTSRDYVIDITNPRLEKFLALRLQLAVAFGTALLTAFAAVLLFDLGTGITGSVTAGLVAALGYALGSIVWGWSTTLFGHAPVAALLTIATWAVWRGTGGPRELDRWRYPVMAGAALGWALEVEFTAIFGGVAIGLWALWRTRRLDAARRWRIYGVTVVVALLMLVPLALYNQLAFGTPFKLGYEGVVGFNGMQQGLFGLTYPKADILFRIIFSPRRGLLLVAPVLLLGAIGLDRTIRNPATRDVGILAAGVAMVVLLVNASYVYWDGGASTGPRHSVVAIPFLALGLAPFWASLRSGWAKRATATLLGLSILLNLAIATTDIFDSDGFDFPLWERNASILASGKLTSLPSDWWGWSPWRGVALYLFLAVPLLVTMILSARRADRRGATVAQPADG